MPTATLIVNEDAKRGRVYFEAFWRYNGRQVKKRIGPAWLERGTDGGWRRPRKRCPEGMYDDRRAHLRAAQLVEEHVAKQPTEGVTFRDLARAYMKWLAEVRGAKPSTLADHGTLLAEPNGKTTGRIMATLGDKPASAITSADITALLDEVAKHAGPRTTNKTRALLHAIYTYGERRAGVPTNPVRDTDRRREPQRPVLDVYSVEEVEALAEAMPDSQDAELIRVAAFTGLRQGELRALVWGDVGEGTITVSRAMSHEQITGTKSHAIRHVPLVPKAAYALARLKQRGDFTRDHELVFCTPFGRPLDRSALRARFKKARDAAGLRPLNFHSLRHAYGSALARAGVPAVEIQAAMGHSSPLTTARYTHPRQASEQTERFAQALSG